MPIKSALNAALFSKFPTNWRNKIRTVLAGILTVPLLAGCGDLFEPTISEICETHSELCLDLSLDARCRFERADIIRLRYYNQDNKDDAYKYPLLLHFEEYLECVEEVQHIEHVKRKGKEATRLKGVITARNEIKRLSRETKTSLDPYLSYYHWTRYNDQDAFHRFERFAASDRVTDPELLVSLASVQIKTDQQRALTTLYRALGLYTDSDNIDIGIYHSLASIGMDSENYRLAYVWYGVAEEFDDALPSIQREQLGKTYDLPVDILNNIIDDITSALNSNTFNAEKLKLNKL
ncbi:hypothetical protein KUL152_18520 [Tenacibaculum sp. KUL152]|uniref:DUF2989 domain-containing protein n=1 Tax=unclassified Alteromonas TaxID=2614992 RepID=UPI0012E63F53|nr:MULTISPECIES: DUF2989 domain-containing protein [unclassified Alteromonas]GFD89626.1 hypothetical protein KUL152_18520 [Tenacibaculum sp. KUL152]